MEATKSYEKWMAEFCNLVTKDLEFKHEKMASDSFSFFRATFYRWVQCFDELPTKVAKALKALIVGDLHVENFGTWMDGEGRMVWGVNDFDEAIPMPFTNDLVRLATSLQLAIREGGLAIRLNDGCQALLSGYLSRLADGGFPFVLSDRHAWLHELVTGELRSPSEFWKKLDELEEAGQTYGAREILDGSMPVGSQHQRFLSRQAGFGSLGRPRVLSMATFNGGMTAREAKAMVPSAYIWDKGSQNPVKIYAKDILDQAVRCPDPFHKFVENWQIRRLGPFCSRIELSSLPRKRDELKLIEAMGKETANVHLGNAHLVSEFQNEIKALGKNWLVESANQMTERILQDFKEYKKGPGHGKR